MYTCPNCGKQTATTHEKRIVLGDLKIWKCAHCAVFIYETAKGRYVAEKIKTSPDRRE